MKIKEIKDFIEKLDINPESPVEHLMCLLIAFGKVERFMPVLSAYIDRMERDRGYTRCELRECASLLSLRRKGIEIEGRDNREIHVMTKHSAFGAPSTPGYDYEREEAEFRERNNLTDYPKMLEEVWNKSK